MRSRQCLFCRDIWIHSRFRNIEWVNMEKVKFVDPDTGESLRVFRG